jgi:hypothetical protein
VRSMGRTSPAASVGPSVTRGLPTVTPLNRLANRAWAWPSCVSDRATPVTCRDARCPAASVFAGEGTPDIGRASDVLAGPGGPCHASSLVGRLARLGCTRIGSPGIFG